MFHFEKKWCVCLFRRDIFPIIFKTLRFSEAWVFCQSTAVTPKANGFAFRKFESSLPSQSLSLSFSLLWQKKRNHVEGRYRGDLGVFSDRASRIPPQWLVGAGAAHLQAHSRRVATWATALSHALPQRSLGHPQAHAGRPGRSPSVPADAAAALSRGAPRPHAAAGSAAGLHLPALFGPQLWLEEHPQHHVELYVRHSLDRHSFICQ